LICCWRVDTERKGFDGWRRRRRRRGATRVTGATRADGKCKQNERRVHSEFMHGEPHGRPTRANDQPHGFVITDQLISHSRSPTSTSARIPNAATTVATICAVERGILPY